MTPIHSHRSALGEGAFALAPVWMLALVLLVFPRAPAARQGVPQRESSNGSLGPFVGNLRPNRAGAWGREAEAGTVEWFLSRPSLDGPSIPVREGSVAVDMERDGTWQADLGVLRAATDYELRVGFRATSEGVDGPPAVRPVGRFRTPPEESQPRTTRLGFGSCAHHRLFPVQPIWDAIERARVEAFFSLGDAPYIDTPDLTIQRESYREFYGIENFARLRQSVPMYATWDDHDFGWNDSVGTLKGKEGSRRAFLEYHIQPSAGSGSEGIYTRARHGAVEVFLLDTRWFAKTGPSFANARAMTLLGEEQWSWLQDGLLASKAPFKVLACGMVWNGAVRPFKRDHWGSYPDEFNALMDFIGDHEIEGVVLVGGDIHRTRVLRHGTAERAGYDLPELITSPLANVVSLIAEVESPEVLLDAGEPESFLLLEADTTVEPATLSARFLDSRNRAFLEFTTNLEELTTKR